LPANYLAEKNINRLEEWHGKILSEATDVTASWWRCGDTHHETVLFL